MRIRRPVLTAAAVIAALSLAGCGANSEGGDVSTQPSPTESVTEPPAASPTDPSAPADSDPGTIDLADTTDLRITVDDGSGQVRTWRLTCDDAGGDHPDPQAACAALARMDAPFAPLPKDLLCTEIYGGPQTAKVEGVYRGVPTLAEFRRTNGCEISRWDAYLAVLVERGGVAGS